ncbi:hypothetical protein CSUI_003373, partial [Cystoisospora suis]
MAAMRAAWGGVVGGRGRTSMMKGEERTRSLSLVRSPEENKEIMKKMMVGEGYVRRRKRKRRIKTEERAYPCLACSYRDSRQRNGHARETLCVLGRRERQRDLKQREEEENRQDWRQRDEYREDFVGGEREERGKLFFLSSSTSCLLSSLSCKSLFPIPFSSFPRSSGLPSSLIANGICTFFSSTFLPTVFASSLYGSSLRESPFLSPSHSSMASLSPFSSFSSSTSSKFLHASAYLSSSCPSQLSQCPFYLHSLSSHSSFPSPRKNISHSTQSRLFCSSSSSPSSPLLSSPPPLSSSSPPSSFPLSSSPCASVSDTALPDTFSKERGVSLCQSIDLTDDNSQHEGEEARGHLHQGDGRLSSSYALQDHDSSEQLSCVNASGCPSESREISVDTSSKESRELRCPPTSTPPITAPVVDSGDG